MIGCSESPNATRYHQVWKTIDAAWALCAVILIDETWPGSEEGERELRLAHPHLERCPRCFGKEEATP